jgi:type IV pilus assembly protein PilB
VYELLVNSPLIRRAIVPHANSDELEQLAIEDGMVPLTDQALKLAQAQLTSLEEVYRVRLN